MNLNGGAYDPYAYQQMIQQAMARAYPQPQPGMTQPIIRAEIAQVADEQAMASYPVGAGESRMMMTKDEQAIGIKSVLANGQIEMVYYDRRPPAEPEPVMDPGMYVRRDELAALVAEAVRNLREEN